MPARPGLRRTMLLFGALLLLLTAAGAFVRFSYPDGLERVAIRLGFSGRARSVAAAPMPDYQVPLPGSPRARQVAAGLLGAAVCFLAAYGIGKYSSRQDAR